METCTNCKKTCAMPVRQVVYGTDLPVLTGGQKPRHPISIIFVANT